MPSPFPPTVRASIADDTLLQFWTARAHQHTSDSYAGVALSKFPEDLRVYEHLLWADRPDTVIEIGTQAGGSALWLRDRLATLTRYGRLAREPLVITVDVDQRWARQELAAADPDHAATIALVEGDVRDGSTVERVASLVAGDARCMVIEDSAHVFDTTRAALEGFAQFVPPGGYFVVEDGCVDVENMRISESWPRGVLPALHAWLQTRQGSEFTVRRDLELYGVSCHPEGFLQRRDT